MNQLMATAEKQQQIVKIYTSWIVRPCCHKVVLDFGRRFSKHRIISLYSAYSTLKVKLLSNLVGLCKIPVVSGNKYVMPGTSLFWQSYLLSVENFLRFI